MTGIVHVVGRFPPPLDGQTIATERLASLLESECDVRRFDTAFKNQALMPGGLRERAATTLHYLRLARGLRQALARAPDAPVLWCSASPTVIGHLRDMAATVPGFQRGQPVWAVVHRGNFDRVFRRVLTRASMRAVVGRLSGFVFLSRALAEQVRPWVPEHKIRVVPNTIDAAVVCTSDEVAVKRSVRAGRCLRLLFLSNMIAEKGYRDVLEAVGLLNAHVSATFAGRWNDEADRAAFHARVAALGLGGAVTHVGAVSDRAAVKALHLASDVFVLPTYYRDEAQPLAVIEALSAGTPVIVTDHASIPEMVEHGKEALFVRARNAEGIARAVVTLSDPAAWADASACARRRFESRFSVDAVRRKWLTLLQERP